MSTNTQPHLSNQVGNPGSKEAIEQGCTCPVMDNAHGKGVPQKGGVMLWQNEHCPIHGSKEKKNEFKI